jgi:lysophospholipase L1-like esterase
MDTDKTVKNDINNRGKKILPVIIPVLLPVLYIVLFYFAAGYIAHYPFPNTPEAGHHHLQYPPESAKFAALYTGLMMVGFVVIIQFFVIKNLTGWKKAIAIVLTVAVFFGGIEYALRIELKESISRYRPHPQLLWELRPNKQGQRFAVNSWGMRCKEFPLEKEPNEYRIMILGDSSAFGAGIEDGRRFSDILEEKLQVEYPDRKIRVVNAAVEGYSIYLARKYFDLRLKKFNPDCLIISFNNDPNPDIMQDKDRLPPQWSMPVFSVLYQSELFLLLKKLTLNRFLETEKGRKIWERKKSKDVTARVSDEDIKENYTYLIDEMKKSNGKTIIMAMPLPAPGLDRKALKALTLEESSVNTNHLNKDYKYRLLLKQISNSNNAIFADIFSLWRKEKDNNSLFIDHVHPTEEGHKLIAEELNRIIKENR